MREKGKKLIKKIRKSRSTLYGLSVRQVKRITSELLISTGKERRRIHMDREMVIQNIVNNYGTYGITREVIEPLIDDGVKEGFSYEVIYWQLKSELSKLAGEEFVYTSSYMARAFGMSDDEMNWLIEEAREELIADGENPDEYFKTVETTKFMM